MIVDPIDMACRIPVEDSRGVSIGCALGDAIGLTPQADRAPAVAACVDSAVSGSLDRIVRPGEVDDRHP